MTKEELIKEIENDTKIGKSYIEIDKIEIKMVIEELKERKGGKKNE